MSFEKLGIKPEIVKALNEIKINKPTKIQEKTIPLIVSGKDVIGISKTGSGKTAAFGVPLLQLLNPGKGLQYLMMAPTRELAVQIATELRKFGKHLHMNVATVYGGVAIQPQMDRIAKADIVVGTPGRLLDHLQRKTLDLSRIKGYVLDEADKMVDMGFIDDITTILSFAPKNRQALLFGATVSDEIEMIKAKFMNNPVSAKTESQVSQDYLEQYYYDVQQYEKFSLLVHILKKEKIDRAIIFCSSRATVELIYKNLQNQHLAAEMIHGKLSQPRRMKVIKQFNEGKSPLLIASAVAARGIHIEHVSHVINYDLSQDAEEYIHRVGRTARAGHTGKAITLISQKDHEVFNAILDRYPVKIKALKLPDFPKIRFNTSRGSDRNSRRSHSGNGNFRGSRRSFGGDSRRSDSRGYSGAVGPNHRPGHPPKF